MNVSESSLQVEGRVGLQFVFFGCCAQLIVTGILKGYDQLLNLVLDNVEEELQGTLMFFSRFIFNSSQTIKDLSVSQSCADRPSLFLAQLMVQRKLPILSLPQSNCVSYLVTANPKARALSM